MAAPNIRDGQPLNPIFEDLIMSNDINVNPGLRESATFDRTTMAEIRRAADTGIYDIRGFGAKRKLPHFDDLLFLGASMSRYPLEGYREVQYPGDPGHPLCQEADRD